MKDLKLIRNDIEKNYGKKCKDFKLFCSVCIAHRTLEDMERVIEELENMKKIK